ncbi:MAG: zinc-binding dehydrogenase [Rhodoblastus sp.]
MTRFGGYADVVCAPLAQTFVRPPDMPAAIGAALPVNYITAWQLVVVMGGLGKNETMLVHSAGGGVGIAATQIARHIGARVIGTASSAKHEALAAMGADHLIDYTREDFEARVREITGGRGVELILDAVGGDSVRKGLRILAPTGRIGMFGASSLATGRKRDLRAFLAFALRTPWLKFNPIALMNENKGVFGVNVGHMWGETERIGGWFHDILDLWTQGAIAPQIARTFPFEEAGAAHEFIQSRRNLGKVLLTP